MPFDFGGSVFDSGIFDNAVDVSSFIDTSGDVFLTDFTPQVNIDYNLGGAYEAAGSFAGDAAYNDFFNAGGFLDNPAAVEAFAAQNDFFSSIIDGSEIARTPGFGFPLDLEQPASLTFGEQINKIAAQVQTDFTGFVKGSQEFLQFYQKIAPVVDLVFRALKAENPINAVIQPFQQVVGAAGVVANAAGSVRTVGNALSTPSTVFSDGTGYKPVTGGAPVVESVAPRTPEEILAQPDATVSATQIVTSAGVSADAPFRELSDAETRALLARTVDPRLVNSTVDSGVAFRNSYNTAIITRAELEPEVQRLSEERNALTNKLVENDQVIGGLQSQLNNTELTSEERDNIARELIVLQAENGEIEAQQAEVSQTLLQTESQLVAAQRIIVATNNAAVSAPGAVAGIPVPIGANVSDVKLVTTTTAVSTPASRPASYNNAVRTIQNLAPSAEILQERLLEQDQLIIKNESRISELQSELATNFDLTEEQRQTRAIEIAILQAETSQLEDVRAQTAQASLEIANQLRDAQQVIDTTDASVVTNANPVSVPGVAPGAQYEIIYNPTTNTRSVFDNVTGTTIVSGLSESEARAAQARLAITAAAIALNSAATSVPAAAADVTDAVFNQEVASRDNSITAGLTNAARNQQSVRDLRNTKAQSSDWRVRLRLAPNSNYLYNDPMGAGVLAPLRGTDGVIFPYTPSIDTAYKANYEGYDLTHSNYRGYFYKNSYVDAINIRATFTAQDTNEANYLLAVIHFFRSATKMFYGATDPQRGAPPPLVYLNGYGDYQFSEHPCVISQFNYQLPPDVDYIRAQNWLSNNTNLQLARLRNPVANNPLSYSVNRIINSGLFPGAKDVRPSTTNNLSDSSPTYVPTKMEISISLLPIQSRQQVSQNFSVAGFANGNLLKGGYW